ncbi:MAG TPA: molybdenum ABC transporter ATP-binding protein [Thermoanaerobaculia bacterium]|nr:molybdenum ABC transporter ATP-binding protein [Thermoanaerobaculia bacterium]
MIELDVRLPLARFPLRVEAKLPSDAVAVLGPSGSGKTSLLESIAGLRRGAAGRIAIRGERVLDSSAGLNLPPERRRIGYVPQDALLFPHLDVRGNVRFGMTRHGSDAAFVEAVAILEIEPLLDQFPATLSGGERQRVALARAIATTPRLLLLDEPLAAVDPGLRGRILPYLLRVREALGIPFLYVTHNAGEARAVADAALVLREGSVVFAGTPEAALAAMGREDPEARFDNILAGRLDEARAGGAGSFRVGDLELAVPGEDADHPAAAAVYCVAPEDVLVSTHPLEGVSARNVLSGRVTAVDPSGANAWTRIAAGGLEWTARVTRAAAEELGLVPGVDVWIAVKTHAFRRLR